MSSPASSKQGSQEPGTPLETDAPNALPDVPPAVPQGTSATEQNMTAVQILRNRGMHDAADVLEQALRAGNAGTDPVVVVNDPGSGEEGEGKDKDAMQEDAKPLAKRRASARIAKQSQHATMSVQEMATKSAPKGVAAAAAQAAAPSTSAAATATTASSTTTGKKGGRGKSPAARSPTVATSKGGAKQADATGSTAAEPSADAGADLSWVNDAIGALSAFVSSSTKQQAAGAPLTPDEAAPQMSPELLAALSRAGMTIEEALARDPTDKQRGYKELEEWVDGALDMYRPEFRPILFPMFLYFYLELVQQAHSEAAQHFFETYSPPLMSSHAAIVNHLKSIKLPHLLGQDELAQRYLDEKYVIRMSRSAFGLLLGWLMEGSGGEAMGVGEGFGGERNKRGRATIRRILNDRIIVDVTNASSTEVPSATWTENTGLISALIPSEREKAGTAAAVGAVPSPVVFNKERGALKLGPAPLPDGLADEATRLLKEEGDADVFMADGTTAKQRRLGAMANDPPLVSPELSELPPRPILFKQIEVKKEVERLRDARKRIRLEPGPLTASDAELGLERAALFAKAGALPSVCAYTFHDAGDGPCSSIFSPDSSLMAAGFNESYIRLWSLKGEKLRGMRSDFNPSSIKDASSIKKLREKHGSTTRKLIGHSAPVYGLAFDPISGSAGSPKYLLSCSSDATTRLWSLETMSNVVVYRGHQTPIWDVEWSPVGVYFATGSRDRTARLWSTDRVAPLRMFAGHMSDVDCVKFHPNSLYLATGSSDTTCRLWDVQRGACVRVFMGHKGAVTSMAMSPDGKYLASAATDQSIILWDLAGGRQVKTMTGHTSLINSMSFSACSSMLVSGSCDWTVRCWDVKGPGGLKSKRDGKDQIEVDGFGLASRSNINGGREEGKLPEGGVDDEKISNESVDLIATFPTKRTPILNVQFTPRNLCLVSGTYIPPPEQTSSNGH